MCTHLKYNGSCHNYAIALQRLSGLPICVLYGEREMAEDEEPEKVLIHAGILSNNLFYDEVGLQGSPEDLLEEFKSINEAYSYTEIMEFDSEKDLLSIIRESGAEIKETEIQNFTDLIKSELVKYPFLSQSMGKLNKT